MKKSGLVLSFLFYCAAGLSLPNPAAVFCVENGWDYQQTKDQDGNWYGICIFNEGGMTSECGDWAYYYGDCVQGECESWSVETNSCEKKAQ